MTAKTRLVIGFKDDVGLERDNMEDAAGYSMTATNMDVRRKGSIFVVADGVGGHQAGEVASKRAVNAILKEYYACPYEDTETSLRFAINQANDAIFKEAQETGRDTMATTVVCAVIREGVLTLANVGDSRIYILRSGKIRQLTEDHSWVNEQIRQGLLTPEEAKEQRDYAVAWE
jgi:serine/threonine protein phosphatase PrpC